mmetsp:Transcript_129957/g.328006  ORF Transcript_129957/g.328006 Transcript_129957/m.328006 type:complete len:214 (-) Transcript_129957:3-644(-)
MISSLSKTAAVMTCLEGPSAANIGEKSFCLPAAWMKDLPSPHAASASQTITLPGLSLAMKPSGPASTQTPRKLTTRPRFFPIFLSSCLTSASGRGMVGLFRTPPLYCVCSKRSARAVCGPEAAANNPALPAPRRWRRVAAGSAPADSGDCTKVAQLADNQRPTADSKEAATRQDLRPDLCCTRCRSCCPSMDAMREQQATKVAKTGRAWTKMA